MENSFQKEKLLKLRPCHAKAFVYGKLPFPAHGLDHQHINKIHQRDSSEHQSDHQIRKYQIQPRYTEIILIFAAPCDTHAPVQPLFVFIQINFKFFLLPFINIYCQLTVRLFREQPIKGFYWKNVYKIECCFRTFCAL